MVRLGFAVAAHLDPEILVVDEVLAVGDAEFQKKAIGKMKDVSRGEGRTVLFVSHNMASIADLCHSCVLLSQGMVQASGNVQDIINLYLADNYKVNASEIDNVSIEDKCVVSGFSITQDDVVTTKLYSCQPYRISFDVENKKAEDAILILNIEVATETGVSVTCFGNEFQRNDIILPPNSKMHVEIEMPNLMLRAGCYYFSLYFLIKYPFETISRYVQHAIKIDVEGLSIQYLADKDREWRMFPAKNIHGYLISCVDSIKTTILP